MLVTAHWEGGGGFKAIRRREETLRPPMPSDLAYGSAQMGTRTPAQHHEASLTDGFRVRGCSNLGGMVVPSDRHF